MELPLNQICCGDCRNIMAELPKKSMHCCITSPPYYGLRDYGVNGQIGLEHSLDEYVAAIVTVFRGVWRVLRDDGTVWLNLGDTYAGSGKGIGSDHGKAVYTDQESGRKVAVPQGLKPKDLCGVPWRVVLALQADGWYWRDLITWSKPNPMPESVTDRCTRATEWVFMLTKKPRYFYDAVAIAETAVESNAARPRMGQGQNTIYNQKRGEAKHAADTSKGGGGTGFKGHSGNLRADGTPFRPDGKRNKRSVWTIPTEAFAQAHFATFPKKLVEPCVLAGTSQHGCCSQCGAPWTRIVEKSGGTTGKGWVDHKHTLQMGIAEKDSSVMQRAFENGDYQVKTLGWKPGCDCNADIVPAVVFDPFMGSGTTAEVAYRLGRNYVGCELNPEYIKFDRSKAVKESLALLEMAQ